MDMASISSALGALRIAVDFTKTAVSVRDDAEIAKATQLLNDRIIDVQNAALQLQEKLSAQRDDIEALKDTKRELGTQIAELEQRKSEREKYKLHEPTPGSFVLAYVPDGDNGGPMHYLCQSCMDNSSKKVVLQEVRSHGRITLICPACSHKYASGKTYPYSAAKLMR